MTAETGTYRWMAPEVIEHRAYNHKADIFSFGILLWELLTGEVCFSPRWNEMTIGLRPAIPKDTHPKLAALLEECWQQDPTLRPNFSEIIQILQDIAREGRTASVHGNQFSDTTSFGSGAQDEFDTGCERCRSTLSARWNAHYWTVSI
ncbi:hypothetical protein QQ045_028174 [Rhodiola kirilowii]